MRHAQIWPCSSVPGIADHSDHAPIIPAGTTVKPARPLIPVRMAFSLGTGVLAELGGWGSRASGLVRFWIRQGVLAEVRGGGVSESGRC